MERKKKEYFKGLKTVWGQQGIQKQIFLSMFLIVLLGVGTLINFMYKASIDAIEQNYRTSYQSTLKNSSRVMDMNLRSIIEAGRSFLNNGQLRHVLTNSKNYGGTTFSTGDQEILRSVANELASQQVWVNYIVFTDLYGHYYQLNNVNLGTYDFYNYYKGKKIMEEDWAQEIIAAKGKEVFFGENEMEATSKDGFPMENT